jgi:hypothetical protein
MTVNVPQPVQKPVSDSLFHMWRCIIVMAHADAVIHQREQDFFDKVFVNMARSYALTDAHRAAFAGDLKSPQEIDPLLARVTDPEARSLLLYFSQAVAWIDGNLSPQEAALLRKLQAVCGTGAAHVQAEIRQEIADQMFRRKADIEERNIERNPLFYAMDALLARLGIEPVD